MNDDERFEQANQMYFEHYGIGMRKPWPRMFVLPTPEESAEITKNLVWHCAYCESKEPDPRCNACKVYIKESKTDKVSRALGAS